MGFLYYLGSVVWNLLIAYTIIASIFAFVLAALGVPVPHFLAVIPNLSQMVNSAMQQLQETTTPVSIFVGLRLAGLFLLNSAGVFIASLGRLLYDIALTVGAPPPLPSLMYLVGVILQASFVVWKILTWIGWRPR